MKNINDVINETKTRYITVDELINILKDFPGDAKVLCSNTIAGALRKDIHKFEVGETYAIGKFVQITKK